MDKTKSRLNAVVKLQRQIDAVAAGKDPAGVSFDPKSPPVVFEAGNYIMSRTDAKAVELLDA